MAEIKPVGIDQTTGQQRQVADGDTVNVGNEIEILVRNTGDYSGCLGGVTVLFPFETPTKLDDPASLATTGQGRTVSWSPNGEFLWYSHTVAPYHEVYQRVGTTLSLLAAPASLPSSSALATAWSNCGTYFVIGKGGTEKVLLYQVDGNDFTLLEEPASQPPGTVVGIDFSPNGEFLVTGNLSTAPYLHIYRREGSTLTLLPTPASLPAGSTGRVKWAPNGEFFAVGDQTSNPISIYQRTGLDEFTRLDDPASILTGFDVAWSADSQYLFTSQQGGPGYSLYKRDGTTFTRLDDPASFSGATATQMAVSPTGKYIVVQAGTSAIRLYERDGDTVTALANPSSVPTNLQDLEFTTDQQFLAYAHDDSPRLFIHQTTTGLPTSGVVKTTA